MKKFFGLYSTTLFENSSNAGCLYNTLNGDVVSLCKEQKDLLLMAQGEYSLDQFTDEELLFFTELERNMLGHFTNSPLIIEPSFWGDNIFTKRLMDKKKNLETLQIQLTSICNLNCIFCDEKSNQVFRETGCKRWSDASEQNTLSPALWLKYISEAVKLGCQKIQFFGGEPLLEWSTLHQLIDYCIEEHAEKISHIEVFTNGSLLNQTMLDYFKQKHIKLIIQVTTLSSNRTLLGTKTDFNYSRLFEALHAQEINFDILLLVTKYNEKDIADITNLFQELDYTYQIRYIYPYPENTHFSPAFKTKIIDYRRKIIKTTPINIGKLMFNNPCYSRILAITNHGDVYPCIMSRFVSYGKLNGTNSLTELMTEKYVELKSLSKEKMISCQNCEFKYACVSCTALEISASKNMFSCRNCNLIQRKALFDEQV